MTIVLELLTGAAGLAGGLALAGEPDGSLVQAKLSALHSSPFTDWRIPGLLLATLVGGGFMIAGLSELARWRHARQLTLLAGAGLVAFECAELRWIGFQPLEAVFAGVGVAVILLRRSARRSGRARDPAPPRTEAAERPCRPGRPPPDTGSTRSARRCLPGAPSE